jgi:phosphomannomutase
MHGVGLETLLAAFDRAGFAPPAGGGRAGRAGPRLPDRRLPEPEEPGALDLLLRLSADADVAIASTRTPTGSPSPWRPPAARDQTGVLLADHLLSQGVRGRVATTVVSSSMLAEVAAAYGVPFSETLTGFKHLARAGDDLVYAYEEALGVAVAPSVVRDKDGMSAALLVAELAALEKARGRTLLDRLADLERSTAGTRPASCPTGSPTCPGSPRRWTTCGRAAEAYGELPRHGGRAAGRRRAGAPAGRRAGGRPAQRHRAQAQGLPRAGRPGRRRDGRAGAAVSGRLGLG